MNEVTLRRPVPDDAPEWVRVHQASWRWSYAHLFPPEFFDERERRTESAVRSWVDHFSRLDEDGWAHEEGGARIRPVLAELPGAEKRGPTVAGIGSVREEPGRLRELLLCYVRPDCARRGVGRALVQDLLGEEPATLWVFKDNPLAIPFYRSLGLHEDGEEAQELGVPAVRMSRSVTSS